MGYVFVHYAKLLPCRGRSRVVTLGLLAVFAAFADASPAAAQTIDPAVLRQVKQATVYIEAQRPNGERSQGSGFFTAEPGVIATNAARFADERHP